MLYVIASIWVENTLYIMIAIVEAVIPKAVLINASEIPVASAEVSGEPCDIAANERILQTDHIAEMIGVTTAANICFQNAKKLFDELRKCMGNKVPGQSTANNPPTEFGFIVHGTEKLFLDSIMVATKV